MLQANPRCKVNRAEGCVAPGLIYGVSNGACRIPGDLLQYVALPGQVGLCPGRPFNSLASRGTFMDHLQSNDTNSTTALEAVDITQHVEPAQQEQDMQVAGTLEVSRPTMSTGEESSRLSEVEDLLLENPDTPGYSANLQSTTSQMGGLKLKQPNLLTKERRDIVKSKLEARGETFDPKKWKRGKNRGNRDPSRGGTPGSALDSDAGGVTRKRPRGDSATPPSAEAERKRARGRAQSGGTAVGPVTPGLSSKDASAIKVAIAIQGFPEHKLTEEQGETIEDAIIGSIAPLEDGSMPEFAGTFMEKGTLIICCLGDATTEWLINLMAYLKPLGETNLVAGLRKDILKTTRVVFNSA